MLKSALPMRWLRWVLLALYSGLILSLSGIAFLGGGGGFAFAALVLTFGSQALLIFGSGKLELSRPIRGWRLVIPATVASLMLAILVGAVGGALWELFYLEDDWIILVALALVAVSWIVWSLLIFIYCRGWEQINLIGRLTGLLLAGSLAALLVSIPAHIIVSRRPGCFVGGFTALGIASGIFVMLWSFGPAILLLFFREKRRFELREARRQAPEPSPESFFENQDQLPEG